MHVLQRVGYYLGGFAVGLVLLAFFLKGSNTEIPSCDYLPNARVLKTIRNKGYKTDDRLLNLMRETDVDTVQLNQLFREGEVDFDKSDPRREPCGIYSISSPSSNSKPLQAEVVICIDEDHVTIQDLKRN